MNTTNREYCKRCGAGSEPENPVNVIENIYAHIPSASNPLNLIYLGKDVPLCTECIKKYYTFRFLEKRDDSVKTVEEMTEVSQ